jgi:tetratricopeptide (TPR) repeat protein
MGADDVVFRSQMPRSQAVAMATIGFVFACELLLATVMPAALIWRFSGFAGLAVAFADQGPWFILSMCLCAVGAIAVLHQAVRVMPTWRNEAVALREGGVSITDWRGRTTTVPWGDIRGFKVSGSSPTVVPGIATLLTVSGDVPLPTFRDHREMRAALVERAGLMKRRQTWWTVTYETAAPAPPMRADARRSRAWPPLLVALCVVAGLAFLGLMTANRVVERHRMAEELSNRGFQMAKARRPLEAAQAFRAAAVLEPRDAFRRCLYSTSLRRLGDLRGAEAEARVCMALAPRLGAGYHALSEVLVAEGRWKEAADLARQELARDPDSPLPMEDLAYALERSGDLAGAETSYRQAASLRPHDGPVRRDLGGVLYRQGKYAEAEKALREAISFRPRDADAHEILSQVLERLGRHEEAVREAQEALRLDPNLTQAKGEEATR